MAHIKIERDTTAFRVFPTGRRYFTFKGACSAIARAALRDKCKEDQRELFQYEFDAIAKRYARFLYRKYKSEVF